MIDEQQQKEITEKIIDLIKSLPETIKSELIAGVFPKPLVNIARGSLFAIHRNYKNKKDLEEFRKSEEGKKLEKYFQQLKESGYFADFLERN